MYGSTDAELSELIGKTLVSVTNKDNEEIVFVAADGSEYRLYHSQSCCESVTVEDIIGDLDDLVGAPIVMAEAVTSHDNPEDVTKEYQDSFTWTFYKFATLKGYVTIRWYGESNGYYGEEVSFVRDA